MAFKGTRRVFLGGLLAGAASACASTIPTGDSGVEVTEYRLGPGDQLRITVFGEAELTGPYLINPQGDIAFPLVGNVAAGGKTISELTAALRAALEQGFVRQPNVAVEVLTYRPFFILGEVRTPGTYPYSANLTVLNAVATAQGFTYRADRRRVFIKHAWEDQERVYPLTTTTPVQPGDTVRIGERLF
ncbi:polysaccharide biosynthesis/export family protein [Vitreimonas sp.]|uniref:polysaccharide biosynthesis/export family protein n=1 Tax=Vitreimonas sp. TaxID=3069702 RepID=UPI002ED877E3